ncbi:MAG: (d)CMP kinase [Bacilli bacterium]|nr:(d)CMP kinase [Bacilli bacterium]
MSIVIAIDGPAGSGKGTVANILSEKLGLVYIDTGAMYRCVALASLRENCALEDQEKIIEIANRIQIEFDEERRTFLDGEDVSGLIRTKEVSQIVSPISSIVAVREILVKKQQDIAHGKNVIMEGRDITTVVLPDANYKFYLDADVDERAKRRFLQNQESGIEMSLEEIKENIMKRDYNDMHKEVGSLMRTDDQVYIDTTHLTIDEVVEKMLEVIKEK